MPRFDANILHLFADAPFVERFARAAACGFAAIELAMPYDHDPEFLGELLERNNLEVAVMNTPAGKSIESRGVGCDPRLAGEFRETIDKAIHYSVKLGRPLLHCLAGMTPTDLDSSLVRDTYLENLRYAARRAADEGISIAVESINSVDRPGYYVSHASQALDLIDAAGEPNVGVILDIYHMAMTDEPLLYLIEQAGAKLFHVQIADVPGKGEPGTGIIDFKSIFNALDGGGYDGWVGLEYRPVGDTEAGLAWLRKFEWQVEGARQML